MKRVQIYTTPTCAYCNQTKAFFAERGIAYEEWNIVEDFSKASESRHKSGQTGVPVTILTDDAGKDHVVVGYDRKALTELLGG
ncbi:MAG: glutaredoxin family protein [Patescibacteria group bacterium]